MKKALLFSLVVGVVLCFAGYALAGGSVYDEFEANASTSQYDSSAAGNEAAQAEAGGASFAENKGEVNWNGWGVGTVAGEANAQDNSKANTFTFDNGLTSKAGAFAENTGSADGEGASGGLGLACFDSSNESFVNVEGYAYQNNTAGETGYSSGTGGVGWNQSYGAFEGTAWDCSSCSSPFINASFSSQEVGGWAKVGGFTEISVDPYGQYQSSDGFTGNFSAVKVYGADNQWTNIQGYGELSNGAFSQDNGASAAGLANGNFEYSGNDFGAGWVKNHTDSYANGSTASSHASGSAGAVSK